MNINIINKKKMDPEFKKNLLAMKRAVKSRYTPPWYKRVGYVLESFGEFILIALYILMLPLILLVVFSFKLINKIFEK